jgi:hypothetical protein
MTHRDFRTEPLNSQIATCHEAPSAYTFFPLYLLSRVNWWEIKDKSDGGIMVGRKRKCVKPVVHRSSGLYPVGEGRIPLYAFGSVEHMAPGTEQVRLTAVYSLGEEDGCITQARQAVLRNRVNKQVLWRAGL